MAKGNSSGITKQVDKAGEMQSGLNGLTNTFVNNFNGQAGHTTATYDNIMNGYNSYLGVNQPSQPRIRDGSFNPSYNGPVDTQNLANYFQQYGQTNGGDPSAVNDPNYWAGIALEKIGKGADVQETLNYLTGRISGGPGGGSGGMGGGAFNPSAYGGYASFANGAGDLSWDPEFRGAISKALGGYGSFAENGGFSPQDIQDIRARAISPTRSIYSRAQQDISRNRSLQGFSPNYTAAKAKMTRDLSSQISDANVNANASIAQMIQQGKLAGLAGLSGTGLGAQNVDTSMGQANNSTRLAGLSGMNNIDQFMANYGLAQRAQGLEALRGMSGMYDTNGRLALGGYGAQNDLARTLIGGSEAAAKIPSRTSQILNGSASAAGTLLGSNGLFSNGGVFGGGAAAPSAAAPVSAGLSSVGGVSLPTISGGTMSLPATALGAPPAVTGASSSASALGNMGYVAADAPALLAPAIAYGLNKGGTALLDWGERAWGGNPAGGPNNPVDSTNPMLNNPTADRLNYNQIAELYGPNSPEAIQFLYEHPWVNA